MTRVVRFVVVCFGLGYPFALRRFLLAALLWFCTIQIQAATLTVQTNRLGSTPSILGYNSGHFYPGGNTREWWRYSGVNGARVFIAPSNIESSDDLAPVGDAVNSQESFLTRRASIRTNVFNPAYINWAAFTNNYANNDLAGNNHILVDNALGELRSIGVEICAQITASQSRLPLAGTTDWPNMWELWQHYYVQAYYLGRHFDVERYQVYNEPNHSSAGGLTVTNFLLRLQLMSDAVQYALEDVNHAYGKSLQPKILSPVTSGSADTSYSTWGKAVVQNLHTNFLGQFSPSFALAQVYDYHQYNSTPSTFGSSLATLHSLLTSAMAPGPRMPTSISEYNTHTGATFDTMTETLDSPTEYPRFGSICVNLIANGCDELYCFKFSQTASSNPNYPVQKNAMHYVNNSTAPYNVGGLTKAGEVWRLVNKAFFRGRDRLNVVRGSGATVLDVQSSYDPVARCYYLLSVNNSATAIDLAVDTTSWAIPSGNRMFIEEVSESCYGGGRSWTNTPTLTQQPWSVLLFTMPAQVHREVACPLSDDAEVRDGANKESNYGTASSITVRNDPSDAANRSVGFLRFQLPTNNLAGLQLAILSVQAASATANTAVQAHVYGITNKAWSQSTIRWANAPSLKQNVPAGGTISQNVIQDLGTNATMLGQLVVTSTTVSEKLFDVTPYLRKQTDAAAFLISQDPRWNISLPSLDPLDAQPDGIRILTSESGSPPRLTLIFRSDVPSITAIQRAPDGSTVLSFQGQPLQTYVVEGTTNIHAAPNWVSIVTNIPHPPAFGPPAFHLHFTLPVFSVPHSNETKNNSMKHRILTASIRIVPPLLLLTLLALTGCRSVTPNTLATHVSAKWEKDIAAYQASDVTNPPPTGCIVFVGSSSIRLWKSLEVDFPGLPVINRGFGGSQLADSVNFADRIITPYKPRQVVIYAGGNDINAGKDPDLVYGDFVALVTKIRSELPRAQIGFISSAPNPRRWAEVEKVKRLNSLVEAYCRQHRLTFINVFPLMLGPDGLPKPDIFVSDQLHMNPKGYAIWREAVAPYLH